jgi:hypothetical protein
MPKKGDKQRFCKRGHDTQLCGRNPANRACRRCQADDQIARQIADPEGTKARFKDWYERRYDQYKDGANAKRREAHSNLSPEERESYLEKERLRSKTDGDRRADPEKRKTWWREYGVKRPLRSRQSMYGLSESRFEEMVAEQNNLCAACGQPETKLIRGKLSRLSVDHDHETGRIRGLLCAGCNSALGQVKDDANRLIKLLAYITRPPQVVTADATRSA